MIWGWLGERNQVWGPCTEGKTRYESCGSVHGEIFMNQRPEKRISSAWRPKFRQKVKFFDKNATKSDFERAPRDISAIPTHLDGSRGPVRDQKNRKKRKCPGLTQVEQETHLNTQTVVCLSLPLDQGLPSKCSPGACTQSYGDSYRKVQKH